MRLLLRIIGVFLLLLFALAIFLVLNTLFRSQPERIASVRLPETPVVSGENVAKRLAEIIRFKTISAGIRSSVVEKDKPWRELHEWLIRTYPEVHKAMTREVVPGGQTLLYTWQGSDKSLKPILMMAHQDVVPVNTGTLGDWKADPFAGEIIQGYVYGRGAIDDKNSLVALMEAAELLVANGFRPRRTVYFLFGHDEEVGGSGAKAGIELLRSRDVRLEMALDEGSFILENFPLTGKPMALIGIAEKGFLSIKLTASAPGGHSSIPPRDSAVVKLSRAILALEKNQMRADFSKSPVAELFQISASHMSFPKRIIFSNLWLFGGLIDSQMSKLATANAIIRTTTAPTMLSGSAKENVIAQRASAVVNFRIHPGDSKETVLSHVKQVTGHISGLEIEPYGIFQQEASSVSPINSRAYAVLAAVGSESGQGVPVAPLLVLGATDSRYAAAITNHIYRFVPVILTPEDISGFHGTNERISIENIVRLVNGYARIIKAMDSPE